MVTHVKNRSWKNNYGRRKPHQREPCHRRCGPRSGGHLRGAGWGAGRRAAARCGDPARSSSAGPRSGPASPAATTTPPVTGAAPPPAGQSRAGLPGPPAAGRGLAGPARYRSARAAARGWAGPGRSAGRRHRQSLPGAGGSRGAAAVMGSRESSAGGGRGCAEERPAGMGPVPPRPLRRSPPPARQEHRAAAAPPRTRPRSAGRAGRRCLSCHCDPPPAATPPPPRPGGSRGRASLGG